MVLNPLAILHIQWGVAALKLQMDRGSGFDIVIVNTHLFLLGISIGFISLGFRWLDTCVSSAFVPL